MNKFTPQQLSDWQRYENVRAGGRYNMFSPQARAATGLSTERYSFVMDNFEELEKAVESEDSEKEKS